MCCERLRETFGISDKKDFGTLRHTSCTIQQINAMSLGFHESYVSHINAHSEKTERDYYVSVIGPEVEIISRLVDDNIEFCESIAAHSIKKFIQNPHKLRYLASGITAIQILGKLQFLETLKRYREGKIELDKMPDGVDMPKNAKSIADISQILSTSMLGALCPWATK